MTIAVLMAGGRSERMTASGRSEHKSLVPALGVPLIERNLCQLLRAGFTDIFVASNAGVPSIKAYVEGRGCKIAASQGATLRHFEETERLGTAGAAVQLTRNDEDVLSIFVDNLSTIDLRAMLVRHAETGAAITVATHLEGFRLPFGEVEARDGYIAAYREKPRHEFPISSGIFVVNRKVLDFVASEPRIDLPELVNGLAAASHVVCEFRHRALWIDVNTAETLRKAEDMIHRSPAEFELWARQPDRTVVAILAISDGCVLLAEADDGLSLPEARVSSVEQPEDALARLLKTAGASAQVQEFTVHTTLDQFDQNTGLVTRLHVFRSTALEHILNGNGMRWNAISGSDCVGWTSCTRRVMAAVPLLIQLGT